MDKWTADLGNGYYKNPVLYTDYSDPDAIRVGEDYYMTASSFCNTPALPILHSKDLVNWKLIGYALENIPENRYKEPVHGCGVWAPAIRYHNNKFYIFFPMPDEGIYVTTADDPRGKWSKPIQIFKGAGWIDPCPFWDDDGRCYMVSAYARSRIGFKSILRLTELDPDCTKIIDMGKDIFDGNVNDQETIEGPKLYKRNGYYYIFAPAGGVKTGWQTVLRSKNIRGPYEYKNVMYQGDTEVNGPHQGAWVDTVTGEDWFLHFQDVYAAGRIVHLQPMRWENDWPIIGEPKGEYGVPVSEYKKPDVGAEYPVTYIPTSDKFNTDKLGLQWQWNANHQKDWYEPTADGLKLFAVNKEVDRCICDVKNLLLQKWAFPEFIADTEINLSYMENGDIAGMVNLGVEFAAVYAEKTENGFEIKLKRGSQTFNKEDASAKEETALIEKF
ncbi:MAG: family 43 glycosylhydrolase, partial [Firmicutes bacterium]|nr:family 43 glycosylhydrolase [Bacillota bacterium]